MKELEKDFKLEDLKVGFRSCDPDTWKEFVQKFGAEPYLWLCKQVDGGKIYIPQYDTQLRGARERAYKKDSR